VPPAKPPTSAPPLTASGEPDTDRPHLVEFDHGYESGYRQAVNDLLSALLPWSEGFIDAQPGRAEDLRKLLYPFEAYLEQRIARMSPEGEFEDGLGI
jgi:hypothetical protein